MSPTATRITPTTPSAVAEAASRLDNLLDLSNIRMKLSNPEEGVGLTDAELDLMEQEYRRFLVLRLVHPEMDVVPCKIVDEMWHRHILDTAAYRKDCQAIFGRFLDHFPYFGLRGPEDAQALQDAYAETLARYEEAFGEPPADTWISADRRRCRTACRPMRCR
jgi:hypothetical protein